MQRTLIGLLIVLGTAGASRTASAQIQTANMDIVGSWQDRFHEDLWERRSGLQVGDFTGIPFNESGQLAAMSWDPGWFAIPEEQCRPHTGIYGLRGPTGLRITAEIDPSLGTLLAYHINYAAGGERTIWMDGRPHPSEDAPHTFEGFSTGRWDGNMLTVRTTHVKAGYLQRNGAPHSDQATATEHFIRQGDSLMLIAFVEDPVFLAEPLIRSTNWAVVENNPTAGGGGLACGAFQVTDERGSGVDKHYVPHYLPGHYEVARDFMIQHSIPPEVAKGGDETLYPEYMPTAKKYQAEFLSKLSAANETAAVDPAKLGYFGKWKLDRGKSTFQASWVRLGLDGLDGTAPARREMVIENVKNGGIHHVTDTQVVSNDTGVFRTEYQALFDGKDVAIKGGALDTVSLKKIDDHTFEQVGKIKGATVATSTFKVSPDGKTLTVTAKGKIPQERGQAAEYSNTQVFVRER